MLYFFHHYELPMIMQQAQLQQILINSTQRPPGPAGEPAAANQPNQNNDNPSAAANSAPNPSATAAQPPANQGNAPAHAAQFALFGQRLVQVRLGARALAQIHDRNNNPPPTFLPPAVRQFLAQVGIHIPIPAYMRRTLNVFGALRMNMAHNLLHLTNQPRLNNLRRITLNSIEIRPLNIGAATITGAVDQADQESPTTEEGGDEAFRRNSAENNYLVEEMVEARADPVEMAVPADLTKQLVDDVATTTDRPPLLRRTSSDSSSNSSCVLSSFSERPLSPAEPSTAAASQ